MAAPVDRVQVLKNESAAGGGDPLDEEEGFPTQLNPNEDAPEVQGLFFQPPGGSSTDELVWITRDVSGNLLFRDNVDQVERTLSSLLTGGGGITPASHEQLDQLVHEIAENSFTELEFTGSRVDAIRTYTSAAKTTKIREQEFTYSSGKVTTIVTRQYDASGTLLKTYTETIAYSGATVTSITGVIS